MSFGAPVTAGMGWSLPADQALPILKHAFDLGINTFDTVCILTPHFPLRLIIKQADIYSLGDSERIIGQALKHYKIPREKVVILSKVFGGLPEDPETLDPAETLKRMSVNDGVMVNRVGLSRKHIFDAVDASISRLGTHLDVLQIHRLDRETPREEIMRALNDVVESGRARYIGSSSVCSSSFATGFISG
jgi:aryl-alcohol dehydrogenase-like predicted oxidoreductase